MGKTFKLVLKRSGFAGCAMKLHYSVNDTLSGTISQRQRVELELPREEFRLKLYFKQFLFPSPERELLLAPDADTEEIVLDIGVELRIIGMIFPLSFFYPCCEFIIKSMSCHPDNAPDLFEGSLQTFKPVLWKKILRFAVRACKALTMLLIVLGITGSFQYFTGLIPVDIKPLWPGSRDDQRYYYELLGNFVGAPILCFALCIIYKILSFLSDKLRQRKIEPVSLSRPFILYLRSFRDDMKTGSSVDMLFSSGKSEEEVTVELLSDIAPVVAIGNPQDKNLPMGANRFYVAEEHWKEKVRQMLDKAKLVVLRLGDTSNLWWEVENCLALCPKEKLIFFIPAMKNFNNALKLCEHLKNKGITIPENLELTIQKSAKGSISSVLYFVDGKICCHTMRTSLYASFYISFKNILRNALDPLFVSFGFRRKQLTPLRTSNIIFSLLLLSVVGLFGLGYLKTIVTRQACYEMAHEKIQSEILECCRQNSPSFAALIKEQSEEKQMETLFTMFGEGLKKMPDKIWLIYQQEVLLLTAKHQLSRDSFYHILCKGQQYLPPERFQRLLKITALGVALTAEKIPDRPAVSESEVSKEIEYFDTAVDNTDDSLSRAKEAETMLRILENMKKKQLDPAKFLRYLMQELASK